MITAVKCIFILNNERPGADLPPPPDTMRVKADKTNHFTQIVFPFSGHNVNAQIVERGLQYAMFLARFFCINILAKNRSLQGFLEYGPVT